MSLGEQRLEGAARQEEARPRVQPDRGRDLTSRELGDVSLIEAAERSPVDPLVVPIGGVDALFGGSEERPLEIPGPVVEAEWPDEQARGGGCDERVMRHEHMHAWAACGLGQH